MHANQSNFCVTWREIILLNLTLSACVQKTKKNVSLKTVFYFSDQQKIYNGLLCLTKNVFIFDFTYSFFCYKYFQLLIGINDIVLIAELLLEKKP